jgi:hypothetical protein
MTMTFVVVRILKIDTYILFEFFFFVLVPDLSLSLCWFFWCCELRSRAQVSHPVKGFVFLYICLGFGPVNLFVFLLVVLVAGQISSPRSAQHAPADLRFPVHPAFPSRPTSLVQLIFRSLVSSFWRRLRSGWASPVFSLRACCNSFFRR